jgi:hypothetical protein
MQVPEGVSCHKRNQVCKLRKSLYGLKQGSWKWYKKLSNLLIIEGYTQSISNYSFFTKKFENHFIAILVRLKSHYATKILHKPITNII